MEPRPERHEESSSAAKGEQTDGEKVAELHLRFSRSRQELFQPTPDSQQTDAEMLRRPSGGTI